MTMKLTLALCLLPILSTPLQAEVYRWTDADGKVHYGDKKPAQAADNVTQQVNTTNLDTSAAERQKLEVLFNKSEAANRQQQEQAQARTEQQGRCDEARRYLRVARGRVMYVDGDNKPVHVSEEARKESEKAVREFLQQECSNP